MENIVLALFEECDMLTLKTRYMSGITHNLQLQNI